MIVSESLVFGVIGVITSLIIGAVTYGALREKVAQMEKKSDDFRVEHEKLHDREAERCRSHKEGHETEHVKADEQTREKFKELYESRNLTALAVERLGTLMEQVFKGLDSLNGKVDVLLTRDPDRNSK